MSNDRPSIPEPIKRIVRQRCGFGCVLCGTPIFHYDHVVDWATEQKHEESNLTLLCPLHHHEKTHGLLSLEQVRAANSSPHTVVRGSTRPHPLHYAGSQPEFILGSLSFRPPESGWDRFVALAVDAHPLLEFRLDPDGRLLLSMTIGTAKTKDAFVVRDNEVVISADFWDVEWRATTLTLRGAAGIIVAQIIFRAPSKVLITKGQFRWNGVAIKVSSDRGAEILGNRNQFAGQGLFQADFAINVGGTAPEYLLVADPDTVVRWFAWTPGAPAWFLTDGAAWPSIADL